MVQAIGAASDSSGGGAGAATSVLEAQLNRYQSQLADWCNCPSGKTPEGKAKIQYLQDKVATIKAQLTRIESAKAKQPSASGPTNSNPVSLSTADTAASEIAARATAPTVSRATTVGGFLDIFA